MALYSFACETVLESLILVNHTDCSAFESRQVCYERIVC